MFNKRIYIRTGASISCSDHRHHSVNAGSRAFGIAHESEIHGGYLHQVMQMLVRNMSEEMGTTMRAKEWAPTQAVFYGFSLSYL